MRKAPQGPALILGVDRGRAMLEERVRLMLQRLRAIDVHLILKTGERAIHHLLVQNEVLVILVPSSRDKAFISSAHRKSSSASCAIKAALDRGTKF